MIATGVYRGRTIKSVTLIEVEESDTESRILDVALEAARETRSSLFGWAINNNGGPIVTVDLHTD